jgi:hypothetical protein
MLIYVIQDAEQFQVRMFKGVKLEGLHVEAFDGYSVYPFIGNSTHLREQETLIP